MSKTNPLVSVFLPVFNAERFIEDSLESVLDQSYRPIEVIVIDDGSTDRSSEILESYAQRCPDIIRYRRNPQNLGITPTCSLLLEQCRGKYIAYSAGDDLWLPGKLENQVELMESGDFVLSYHDVEVFDSESGNAVRRFNSGRGSRRPSHGSAREVARRLIREGTGFMSGLSVVALRSALPSRGYDLRIRNASDQLFFIETLARSSQRVAYLPETYARYRRHPGNITNQDLFEDIFLALAVVESRCPEYSRDVAVGRSNRYFARGGVEFLQGNPRQAIRYFGQGARYGALVSPVGLVRLMLYCAAWLPRIATHEARRWSRKG